MGLPLQQYTLSAPHPLCMMWLMEEEAMTTTKDGEDGDVVPMEEEADDSATSRLRSGESVPRRPKRKKMRSMTRMNL
jgi:hypothetical protein